jgi:hypothetical protein
MSLESVFSPPVMHPVMSATSILSRGSRKPGWKSNRLYADVYGVGRETNRAAKKRYSKSLARGGNFETRQDRDELKQLEYGSDPESFSASASAPQDNFPARQPESLKTQHCVGGVSLIKACCYQFLCCNFVALAFSWP